MLRIIYFLILISYFPFIKIQSQENLSALIPYPNNITLKGGEFILGSHERILINSENLIFAAEHLQSMLSHHFNMECSIKNEGRIILQLDSLIKEDEEYHLDISTNNIIIKAKTSVGILYGVYTLEQLIIGDVINSKQNKIQNITIIDSPILPFRALMLDPARHFIPVEDIKIYIDQMARFKYNVLQLHLTDDQGWRIEIKNHPRLTEIGAFRNKNGNDNGPDNGFYTQEQIKEIVHYADQRNIQIIPEIDIPGHTAALLTAYPELRCDFLKDSIFVIGKTDNVMLSATNPLTYKVLDDILREVSALFPSKMIHLGGDESAISKNWAKSEEHLNLMKKKGYSMPEELMNIFFTNVLTSVRNYGMKAILWCELDNIYIPANKYLFDYPNDVILVTWRMGLTPKCIELTSESKNTLILAPGEYCYLDYPQYKNDLPEFLNWGMPITTLEKTYSFDPTYNLPSEKVAQIQGILGTLWGEAIKDINRANYMTWPRGLALAEAGWTKKDKRNWESFKSRLYPNLSLLMKRGISFRVPFEITNGK